MKITAKDFFYSTITLTFLLLITCGSTYALSVYFAQPFLGVYYPVFNIIAFVFIFGMSCGLFIQALIHIKPFESGKFDMNSDHFTQWKLYIVIYEFGRKAIAPFVVVILKTPFEKLFGAKIGMNVVVSGTLVDSHMITIEDNVIVGQGSIVASHYMNSGEIVLQPTILRRGCTVGGGAIALCCEIGENSVIAPLSFVGPGTVVPPNELWGGFPARRIKKLGQQGADNQES